MLRILHAHELRGRGSERDDGGDREVVERLVRVDVPRRRDRDRDRSFDLIAGALRDAAADLDLRRNDRRIELRERGRRAQEEQREELLHFLLCSWRSTPGNITSTFGSSGEFGNCCLNARSSFAAPSRLPCCM